MRRVERGIRYAAAVEERVAREPGGEQPPEQAGMRPEIGDAWPIFGAVLICLAVILLLNTKALLSVVERRPSGPLRTALLAASRPLDRAAVRVGLDRPAAWLTYAQVNRGEVPQFTVPPGEPTASALAPTPTATPAEPDEPTPSNAPPGGAAAPIEPTAEAGAPPAAVPTATPTAGPTATATPPPRRAITAAAPLRIYVAGDSIVYGFAEVLAETAPTPRLIATVGDVHSASGLSDPTFFDWPARMRAAMANTPPPEAVVFMVGANDGITLRTPAGEIVYGSAAWKEEYARRAAEIMDIVGQRGTRLYYIGQPVMRESKQSRIADDINVAVAGEAAKRPWVIYVDSWSLLVDQNGEYSTFLVDANGERVKARADDGIHLTAVSTVWVANAVYAAIREDWGLGR